MIERRAQGKGLRAWARASNTEWNRWGWERERERERARDSSHAANP